MTNEKAVFISHASKNAGLAKELCDVLEELGVNCWIAPRDIAPGASYGDEIVRGIEQCPVVVLLLTKDSNASRAVANELELAFAKHKVIVPVRLESIKPSTLLEFFISNAQWVDACVTPLKRRAPEILAIVHSVLAGRSLPRIAPESPTFFAQLERRLEGLLRYKVLTAVFVLLIVGATTALAIWRMEIRKSAPGIVVNQSVSEQQLIDDPKSLDDLINNALVSQRRGDFKSAIRLYQEYWQKGGRSFASVRRAAVLLVENQGNATARAIIGEWSEKSDPAPFRLMEAVLSPPEEMGSALSELSDKYPRYLPLLYVRAMYATGAVSSHAPKNRAVEVEFLKQFLEASASTEALQAVDSPDLVKWIPAARKRLVSENDFTPGVLEFRGDPTSLSASGLVFSICVRDTVRLYSIVYRPPSGKRVVDLILNPAQRLGDPARFFCEGWRAELGDGDYVYTDEDWVLHGPLKIDSAISSMILNSVNKYRTRATTLANEWPRHPTFEKNREKPSAGARSIFSDDSPTIDRSGEPYRCIQKPEILQKLSAQEAIERMNKMREEPDLFPEECGLVK